VIRYLHGNRSIFGLVGTSLIVPWLNLVSGIIETGVSLIIDQLIERVSERQLEVFLIVF